MSADPVEPGAIESMSDEELDRYVLTRLALAGVDISVLPEDDPEAPADQLRILRSARSFLRETLPGLESLDLGSADLPPELYPASLFPRIAEEGTRSTQAPDGG